MSVLNVDTTQMNVDAEGFYLSSTVAGQIASYLQTVMASLQPSLYGNDEVGRAFYEQLGPGVQALHEAATGVRDLTVATSDGIVTSAKLFDKSNAINEELAG